MTERDLGSNDVPPAPPRLPRDLSGWVATALLASLLISLAVWQWASPDRPAEPNGEAPPPLPALGVQDEAQLKMMAVLLTLPGGEVQARPQIAAAARQAAREANLDESGAYVALLLARMAGEPAPQKVVELLGESKSRITKEAAVLLTAENPDPVLLARLTEEVAPDSVSSRILRAELKEEAGRPNPYEGVIDPIQAFWLMAVLLGAAFAVALGVIALILMGTQHARGTWVTRRLDTAPTLPDADRFAFRFAAFFVFFVLASVVAGPVLGVLRAIPPLGGLGVALPGILTFVLVALFLRVPMRNRADSLRSVFGGRFEWRHVWVGIGGFLANLPLLLVVVFLVTAMSAPFAGRVPAPSHPINEILTQGVWAVIGSFLAAAIMAPLLEELTFRGLLFPALTRIMPVFGALALQGFVFAAIHPQGPLAWPMLMMVGMVAGFVAWKEGSLWPAVVMHAAHNGCILILALSLS
ncbi:MAG: CPBP family intramembrane metalloprotease [Fimbriimonadaceae bacterium]|nr:CPBP family intramembrane metalloprotease [Fimbriimonadaceae bacterium]